GNVALIGVRYASVSRARFLCRGWDGGRSRCFCRVRSDVLSSSLERDTIPYTLVHVHAITFTAWILLFAVQSALVERKQRPLHKRLGIAGAGLAATMIVLGYRVSISAARRGFMGQFPRETGGFNDALAFLTLGLGDVLTFATFVVAAFWFRARAQVHK